MGKRAEKVSAKGRLDKYYHLACVELRAHAISDELLHSTDSLRQRLPLSRDSSDESARSRATAGALIGAGA